MSELYATGRRKTSVARVWLKSGEGKIIVNKKDLKEYFDRETHITHVLQPLEITSTIGKYDVKATVKGGGKTGQAGALRLGISRALSKISEDIKRILSQGDFLRRDPRMVERKKYGKRKARRSFQFSKR